MESGMGPSGGREGLEPSGPAGLRGASRREPEEGDLCPACNCCSLLWVECENCGGEGETEPGDLYEMDPLWYDEDDTEPCDICDGKCGWLICGGHCGDDGKHTETERSEVPNPSSGEGSNPPVTSDLTQPGERE